MNTVVDCTSQSESKRIRERGDLQVTQGKRKRKNKRKRKSKRKKHSSIVEPEQRDRMKKTFRIVDGVFNFTALEFTQQASDGELFRQFQRVDSSWQQFEHKIQTLQGGRGVSQSTMAQMQSAPSADSQSQSDQLESARGRIKVLYLVRHAQGIHNATIQQYGEDVWCAQFATQAKFLDSELTSFGIADAQQKGHEPIRQALRDGMPPIEKIVVSPMRRTIQTAKSFFPHEVLASCQPLVAVEMCRECLGKHTCDKRSTRTELIAKFPDVDFAHEQMGVRTDQDTWWQAEYRETDDEMKVRAYKFLCLLFEHVPETYVAVVSHSGFIRNMMAFLSQDELRVFPQNCEMVPVCVEMIDSEAAKPPQNGRIAS